MARLNALKPFVFSLLATFLSSCGAASLNDGVFRSADGSGAALPPPKSGVAAAAAPASSGLASEDVRKVSLSYTSLSDPRSASYKIGPLDILDITVFKVPELSKTIQVTEAGTMNFPLIGEVAVGDKSPREVEAILTKRLGAKYLQNPQLSVFVKEHNSQRVTVEGAVKKPGVLPLSGGLSLVQAIAQAQGLDDAADSTVVVFRSQGGKRYIGHYDISEIRSGRAEDPVLLSGDVVIVPTSDLKHALNTVIRLAPLATLVPLL